MSVACATWLRRATLLLIALCLLVEYHMASAMDAPGTAPAAATATTTTTESSTAYAADVAALATADYATKTELIRKLMITTTPGADRVLGAMLDGTLYVRSSDQHVFIGSEDPAGLKLTDAVTLKDAGTAPADGLEKVNTNNQLRKQLRAAVARFKLASSDDKVRLNAVNEMLRSPDEEGIALLRSRLPAETSVKVRAAINTGIALGDLDSGTPPQRLAAVQTLSRSLNSDVYNRLLTITTPAADGSYAEADPAVLSAARKAVATIERWRAFSAVGETMFFGLSLGSVLVLSAIGLAITFGVMGVINMAHGELMMLGAYTAYVVQLLMPQHIGASVLVAIPLAFIVSGAVGILIERGLVRFLYGRPLETLLATFGVSLILQQVVRDVFSPNNRPVQTPDWMAGSMQINEAFSITYNRLYIVLFCGLVFGALQLVLKRTTLGLNVRAVALNRPMAKAMGIRTDWVDAATFGLGSGIAGIAGVALSQLTNVGPNLGQQYIVDSFMVVVFGGVGNLWGTLISGMSLGVINKLLEPYAGAVLAKIFVLVGLILFIQRRPRGLFPQKGRYAEN